MLRQLRTIHLYLGCFFAPLLIFFAISGIWQRLKLHLSNNNTLALISTIHTSRGLKSPGTSTLSSPLMDALVIVMGLGLVATTIIGVLLAFRFGQRRGAVVAVLVIGVVLPLFLVLIQWFS
jgi:hypothetical protein